MIHVVPIEEENKEKKDEEGNKKEEEMIDKVEGNKMTEEDEVNIVGSISIREEKKDEVPKEENKIDNE